MIIYLLYIFTSNICKYIYFFNESNSRLQLFLKPSKRLLSTLTPLKDYHFRMSIEIPFEPQKTTILGSPYFGTYLETYFEAKICVFNFIHGKRG